MHRNYPQTLKNKAEARFEVGEDSAFSTLAATLSKYEFHDWKLAMLASFQGENRDAPKLSAATIAAKHTTS